MKGAAADGEDAPGLDTFAEGDHRVAYAAVGHVVFPVTGCLVKTVLPVRADGGDDAVGHRTQHIAVGGEVYAVVEAAVLLLSVGTGQHHFFFPVIERHAVSAL